MFAFIYSTFAFLSTKCASRVLIAAAAVANPIYCDLWRVQRRRSSQHCRISNFELHSARQNVYHFLCSFYGKKQTVKWQIAINFRATAHIFFSQQTYFFFSPDIFKRDAQLFSIQLFALNL